MHLPSVEETAVRFRGESEGAIRLEQAVELISESKIRRREAEGGRGPMSANKQTIRRDRTDLNAMP